jgi:hypothetical protein
MKIFGKDISEYVKFEAGFLILILVVGLARLILSVLGVPNSAVKFLSLTVLLLIGMLYYSVRVYTTGFGSYKQLLPVIALQSIVAEGLVIAAIIVAMLSGHDNIYSSPEFSPGKVSGRTWGHVGGHLMAMVFVPLVLWLLGSLVMFVTKKLTSGRVQKQRATAS